VFTILLSLNLSAKGPDGKKKYIGYGKYNIGQRLDNSWEMKIQDAKKSWKYGNSLIDTNIYSISFSDTICRLLVFQIDEKKKEELKQHYNSCMGFKYDSTYHKKTKTINENHSLVWRKRSNPIQVSIVKSKINDNFGKWILEIRNTKLYNKLRGKDSYGMDLINKDDLKTSFENKRN
jgi:hypothetical protein